MLVSFENVSFGFGAQSIIEDLSWQIFPGQRLGLIGLNGAGKSTLLRLIDEQFMPDEGKIQKAKNTKVGFLNQDSLSFETKESILQVAMSANQSAMEASQKLQVLTRRLETDNSTALQDEYNQALYDYEAAGGYDLQHNSEIVLEGLGFKTADLVRFYAEFSGGWRMRVLLAKLILESPDLLLLDEPTNHLDLPAIEWLEKYLQSFPGAIIIISHDRLFLDRMCDELVELERRTLTSYKGNYEYYLNEKTLRKEQQSKQYANQQAFIKQQERFIERFKAKASKATQAKSIQKKLDKLDLLEGPEESARAMNLKFTQKRPSGKIVLDIKNLGKKYGDNTLMQGAHALIDRGDKIGLIGANGVGKTTLLHMIAGIVEYEGEIKKGHHVDESLYSQHQVESLHLESEILQELQNHNSSITENEARSILGCFLFSGDDVYKRIKVLSGGEKSRVALAKILTSQANFLLLDEPTNHLDMISKDILVQALDQYEGTYIMVSHDRDFLSRTTNKIWEIHDHQILEYPGSYLEWKRDREEAEKPKSKPTEKKQKSKAPKTNKRTHEQHKELKKLYNKSEKLEAQIEQLKTEENKILESLADPALYAEAQAFATKEAEHKEIQEKINKKSQEYDQVLASIIDLED